MLIHHARNFLRKLIEKKLLDGSAFDDLIIMHHKPILRLYVVKSLTYRDYVSVEKNYLFYRQTLGFK